MKKRMMLAIGAGAIIVATGVGAAVTGVFDKDKTQLALTGETPEDCRAVASAETGFDPATTPVPVHEDAGDKQVLKGTAVGAAVGAVAGEVIGDKAGYGAAAGAAAGAAGGQAVKADKQKTADEQYAHAKAQYDQQKAAYDAALITCLNS